MQKQCVIDLDHHGIAFDPFAILAIHRPGHAMFHPSERYALLPILAVGIKINLFEGQIIHTHPFNLPLPL